MSWPLAMFVETTTTTSSGSKSFQPTYGRLWSDGTTKRVGHLRPGWSAKFETAMTVWFPKKIGWLAHKTPKFAGPFPQILTPGEASWCSSRFVSPKASRKMENLQLTTGLSKHWMIYFQVMVGKWGLKSKPWDLGGPIFRQTQANPSKHCGLRYLPSNTFANLIELELNP